MSIRYDYNGEDSHGIAYNLEVYFYLDGVFNVIRYHGGYPEPAPVFVLESLAGMLPVESTIRMIFNSNIPEGFLIPAKAPTHIMITIEGSDYKLHVEKEKIKRYCGNYSKGTKNIHIPLPYNELAFQTLGKILQRSNFESVKDIDIKTLLPLMSYLKYLGVIIMSNTM
jgi:hypothetical protein